jgi:hypothetical protein
MVSLIDYMDTDIFKSFDTDDLIKAREGLIPLRKQVTSKGKTFMRTYWIKPKDAKSFNCTKDAAMYLVQVANTLEYFSKINRNLQLQKDSMGKLVYESMKNLNEKSVKLSDTLVKTAEWTGNTQSNIGDLMVALKQKFDKKGNLNWKDVEGGFADIVYKLSHSGVSLTDDNGKEINISVVSEPTPQNWGGKLTTLMSFMKKKMSESVGRVTELFNKKKQLEKDYKMNKENEPEVKPVVKINSQKEKLLKKEIEKRPRKKVSSKNTVVNVSSKIKKRRTK